MAPYLNVMLIICVVCLVLSISCVGRAFALRQWNYVTASALLALVYVVLTGLLIVLAPLIP